MKIYDTNIFFNGPISVIIFIKFFQILIHLYANSLLNKQFIKINNPIVNYPQYPRWLWISTFKEFFEIMSNKLNENFPGFIFKNL